MRYSQLLSLGAIAALCAGGASAPPAPSTTAKTPNAPTVSGNQKMTWILRLEDQRILRAPEPPPAAVTTPAPAARGGSRKPAPPPPVVVTPDLAPLVGDADPRVRRRAALAIGRVGLPEGVALVRPLLTDTHPDVRQMAAFALGLLADQSALPPLIAAMQKDTDARVRGHTAEALGLIGDAASAGAVSDMVSAYIKAGAVALMAAGDEPWATATEAEADAPRVVAV